MSKGVLIGIIGNDAARFHEFTASTLRLRRPLDSHLEMLIGGDWCGARNALAEQCVEEDFTHLWFMDDDHSFSPDLLLRLLAWEKPLVTPVCLQRVFPFAPVEYVKAPPHLAHHGDYVPLDLSDHPGGGLIEIESGGAAGMLIRRDVLEAVEAPWFEYGDVSEDIRFCEKAKQAGVTIYADLGARLGHITTCVVIPSHTEEHGWTTGLRIGKDYDIRVKQTYDLIEDGRREPAAASAITKGPALDEAMERLREESAGNGAQGEPATDASPPEADPANTQPQNPADRKAERIEIWMDEELRWWWRAVGFDGTILWRDSGVNENVVIDTALRIYPDTPVYQIQREIDDSRSPKRYGPPTRLWNKEPQ